MSVNKKYHIVHIAHIVNIAIVDIHKRVTLFANITRLHSHPTKLNLLIVSLASVAAALRATRTRARSNAIAILVASLGHLDNGGSALNDLLTYTAVLSEGLGADALGFATTTTSRQSLGDSSQIEIESLDFVQSVERQVKVTARSMDFGSLGP